jgi:hypothetical protein
MVQLDRTIGVPYFALTGLFGLMVRSSRTMTIEGDKHSVIRARIVSGTRAERRFHVMVFGRRLRPFVTDIRPVAATGRSDGGCHVPMPPNAMYFTSR